ncbi:MAG: response regulator transcription factor [Armatimonadetes bacterium]|nr:response regulator transcription factor [Armatimonadota bacterium]MCX7967396.1 response regulator transcription factor [Armatimonadota bacterium]MDW8142629.1 response regulator transcription factor [Armatimonadota bacterium]
MNERILIVEDELPLAQAIAYALKREGFQVRTASDGQEGLRLALTEKPDLVILDLMLPKLDGWEVCRTLRAKSKVPILILTARGEEQEKVLGLELGADDYVVKPFSMRELIARVRALLRRAKMVAFGEEPEVLQSGNLTIYVSEHRVELDGKELTLAPREFALLKVLMLNKGRVLSREQLLELAWGQSEFIDQHTVDVHVHWLREKIEPDPKNPRRIVTVRGVGYRFVE